MVAIAGQMITIEVLPAGRYDPSRTGGTVQLSSARGERRTIYLDLGRLPLDQQDLDERDMELLEEWWHKAGTE